MKKLLFGLIALSMIVLFSCEKENTPGSTVKDFFLKIGNGEYELAVDMMAKEDRLLDEQEKRKALVMLQFINQSNTEKEGIKDVEISNEIISDDGKTALVSYKIIFNKGDPEESDVDLVFINDAWKFAF